MPACIGRLCGKKKLSGAETDDVFMAAGKNLALGNMWKLGIAVLLLSVLYSRLDAQTVLANSRGADLWLLCAAFFVTFLNNLLCGLRWWFLNNRVYGIKTGLAYLLRMYFVGGFFNLFLPGTAGGGVFKAYMVRKISGKTSDALHAIFFDRLLGLLSMACIAGLSTVLLWGSGSGFLAANPAVAGAGALLLVAGPAALFVGRALPDRKSGLMAEAKRFFMKSERPRAKLRETAVAAALALASQLLVALCAALIAAAFGIYIEFPLLLVIVPLATTFALIPVTIGGLGTREFSYVYLLSLAGVLPERAVLLPSAVFAALALNGLIGAIFYIRGKSEQDK